MSQIVTLGRHTTNTFIILHNTSDSSPLGRCHAKWQTWSYIPKDL